jgi:hypothetical protein
MVSVTKAEHSEALSYFSCAFSSQILTSKGNLDSGQIGCRNLADRIPSPDSGGINRMLSDSDNGNISMVVGCLNVKVDCAV